MMTDDLNQLKMITSTMVLMFVEDDENARKMYEKIFKRLFETVHTFRNGSEAFEFYRNNNFSIDLVITDITMPVMSGIVLAEKIKDIYNEQKIIMLSAHDDKDKIFKLINIGVDGFITKPPSQEDLYKTIFRIANIISDKKELMLTRQQIAFKNKISSQQAEHKASLMNTIKAIESENIKISTDLATIIPVAVETPTKPVETPYSNIDEYTLDDISELREIIDDIDYFIARFFGTQEFLNMNADDTDRLANLYAKYSFILKSYPSFSLLSEKLFELSCILRALDTHEHEIDISHIGDLLECINQSLLMFQKQVMEEQSVEPNFYDASLVNDINMTIETVSSKHSDSAECIIEFF
jgi:CheY-like chemotaxis protein